MDSWAFMRLMSGCYFGVGLLLTIGIPLVYGNRFEGKDRKQFYTLVALLVPLGTFCLWLMWICMYMAQMNPMISPIKYIHEHTAHAEKAAA
ncbi:V-type ATPase V0 subunit E, putative [Babesia caballi]|uniref:V-type ATPase V0 subunit E, putative n=1 Tax=Babesia caballi TaxID=5871 RepID=A0AAV4LTZ3_BABCB|nr:V-type ATPase V0 subunit E, putative [Babesia caballi]